MFEAFFPDECIGSAYDIDYESLYEQGYRGIIYDIDNTLVPHDAPADERAIGLFGRLSEIGFSKLKKGRSIKLPDETKLLLSDIVYTDRMKHYVYFYLSDSSTKTVRLTQNDVISLLIPNSDFISVGQGTIVNLSYVKEISKGTLILHNGTIIPIPRRRYKEIKDHYARHCFESSIRAMLL